MDGAAHWGRLGQVARTVGHIEAAVAWYRDVLGLTHLYTYGRLAFFDLDGTRLMLSQPEDGVQADSILYFRVDDIAAAHAALLRSGVSFRDPPRRIFTHPDGIEEWMAFFDDPDGRPLALCAQVRGTGTGQ